ncbi:hypothetical protein H6CHR_04067 [Variovorax sp. PBL-H6]|nr:hypothetical protein H6CHR_04067 [Variovorax sp. PBL-H6]
MLRRNIFSQYEKKHSALGKPNSKSLNIKVKNYVFYKT